MDAPAIRMPPALPAPEGGVPILLRPMTLDDEAEWNEIRWRNQAWLAPWESGDPMHGGGISFNAWLQRQRRDEHEGSAALFVIVFQGRIVGQISLGAICYGSMRTGVVGYWIDERHIGRGMAPMAVAILADWAFIDRGGPRLHRLEIAILPENRRSRQVVAKVGAHEEGLRPRYMYINGRWRDHETYSLLSEDAGEGFAGRLVPDRGPTRHA